MKKFLSTLLLLLTVLTAAIAQNKEVRLPEKPTRPGFTNFAERNTGFWISLEADGGCSLMEGKKATLPYTNLCVTGGYRLSEYLRLGVGLGARVYYKNADYRDSNSKFALPLYVNVRGNFMSAYERQNVPFWSLNIGGIVREGFFAQPTLGYSFGGTRNNFLLGITYTISCFKNFAQKDQAYSYLGLRLGYEF